MLLETTRVSLKVEVEDPLALYKAELDFQSREPLRLIKLRAQLVSAGAKLTQPLSRLN